MASNVPTVDLGRVAMTQTQMKALEIMLYQMADIIDRLLKDRLPYTQAYEDEVVLQKEGA